MLVGDCSMGHIGGIEEVRCAGARSCIYRDLRARGRVWLGCKLAAADARQTRTDKRSLRSLLEFGGQLAWFT